MRLPDHRCGADEPDAEIGAIPLGRQKILAVAAALEFFNSLLGAGRWVVPGPSWGWGELIMPKRSVQHSDPIEVEVDGIGRPSKRIKAG